MITMVIILAMITMMIAMTMVSMMIGDNADGASEEEEDSYHIPVRSYGSPKGFQCVPYGMSRSFLHKHTHGVLC